jgi:hypothetical protein
MKRLTNLLDKANKFFAHEWLFVLLLFLVGLIIRSLWLEARDLSIDEPFSVYHAQKSVGDIIRFTLNNEPNPPLHFILLHGFISLLGDDIWAVRLLSAICSSLTAVLIFKITQQLSNTVGGLFSWALFTFSTLLFLYGMEARPYPLFWLAFTTIIFCWVQQAKGNSNKKILGLHLLAAVVLLYTHYLGTIALAGVWLVSMLSAPNWQMKKQLTAYYALATLLFLPQFIGAYDGILHRGANSQPFLPDWHQYRWKLYKLFNHTDFYEALMKAYIIGIPLLIWKTPKDRHILGFLGVIGILLYTALYFGSQYVQFFQDVYLLFTTLPLLICLGILLGRIVQYRKLPGSLLTLFILYIYIIHFEPFPKNIYYRDIKGAVEAVTELRKNEETVFIYPPWTENPYLYEANRSLFRLAEPQRTDEMNKIGLYRIMSANDLLQHPEAIQKPFILYLDEYTGSNPLGEMPFPLHIRDSIRLNECYLVLYCVPDSNGLKTDTSSTVPKRTP